MGASRSESNRRDIALTIWPVPFTGLSQNLHRLCTDRGEDGKRKKNKQSPKKFCTLNILLGCRQAILLGRGGTLGQSTGLDRLCTDFLCPPLQNSKGKPWSAPGLSFRGGREGQPAPPSPDLAKIYTVSAPTEARMGKGRKINRVQKNSV